MENTITRQNKIDYVEFPSRDLESSKRFFSQVFGWEFVDYGPDYVAFTKAGLEGGFYRAELETSTRHGSALVVIYSDNLQATQNDIEAAGGEIVKAIFSFPGGRRFHFSDPNGNEYAVWSDQ